MPIKAVRMNVIPMPRKGAGMFECDAKRSRIAAMAVIANNQPIPQPAPAQNAEPMPGNSRCSMNNEPPRMAQFTAIKGKKMPSDA